MSSLLFPSMWRPNQMVPDAQPINTKMYLKCAAFMSLCISYIHFLCTFFYKGANGDPSGSILM